MNAPKVTIRITLDSVGVRLLVVALLVLSLTGSVASAGDGAAPAGSDTYAPLLQGVSGRQYYLTQSQQTGKYADEACASGYHMASLWEILDVSNLVYDTALGFQHDPGDVGEGPPTDEQGWVRTGDMPNIVNNCAVWSSEFDGYYGAVVYLPSNWSSPGSTVGVWLAETETCDTSQRVWCVED